jgi:hypothetical protein
VPFRPDPHQQHFQTGMQQNFEVTAKHIQAVVFCMHLHYGSKLISCKIKEKNIFSLDFVLLHLSPFYLHLLFALIFLCAQEEGINNCSQ